MTIEEINVLSDEEIIALILKRGDPKYFGIIYDRYSKRIFNKSYSFFNNKNLAEDVTHDILLKVYLNLKSFSNRSRFSTWVFSITYNYCVDFQKKHNRLAMEYFDYVEADKIDSDYDESMPFDEELFKLQSDRIKLLIHLMPDEEKVVILLKYQDEMSVKEISAVVEISESATKMRLKRGRERLLKMYQEKYAHNVI